MEQDVFSIKLCNNISLGYKINGKDKIIKEKKQNSLFNY